MKKLKSAIIILSIAVIVISLLCLFKVIDSNIGMPISLLMLGILNIMYAYNSFQNQKKMDTVIYSASSLFLVVVSIVIFIG